LQLIAVEERALQIRAIAGNVEPEGNGHAVESDVGVPAAGWGVSFHRCGQASD